jgi:hypothetical protein
MHVTLNVIYHQWGEREIYEAYASLQETRLSGYHYAPMTPVHARASLSMPV